jgi:hypothetical protein
MSARLAPAIALRGPPRAVAVALPVQFVVAILFASLVLQRFGLPVGDLRVHAVTPVALVAAIAGLHAGTLGLDRRRVALLLALGAVALVSTAARANLAAPIAPRSSLPSLAYWLFLTSFVALSFGRAVPEEWFFRRVAWWLGLVAVAGLAQFAAQFAGLSLFSFAGLVPGSLLVEHLFAVEIALESGVMRSNGFFLVEPSVFSQLMAVGLMIETLYFRRTAWMALFLAGLLAAVSGTGWLVLGAFVVQLGIGLGLRGAVLAAALAMGLVLGLVALSFLAPEIAEGLFDRMGEFSMVGTSGYERFVTPWLVLRDVLDQVPWALATGLGPGTAEQLTLPYVYHVNTPLKLLLEYGIAGLGLYLAAILSARRTRRQRTLVLPMLVLLLLTGGYHQFAPMLFLVVLVITVARLEES